MRKFCRYILLFIFIFFVISNAKAAQIGIWDSFDDYNIKTRNIEVQKVSKQNITRITPQAYPVILFTSYHGIDGNVYNEVLSYIKRGGKVILSLPILSIEYDTYKKLAKELGVNVNQIIISPNKTDVSWVEKTLSTTLPQNSKIAKVSLDAATHLAVFGEIERHESAISASSSGAVISWCWGSTGNNSFNEKSLLYIVDELSPKNTGNHHIKSSVDGDSQEIDKINYARNYIEQYQSIPSNLTYDISASQQQLALSKIDEIWALYYLKNGNTKEYLKHIKQAKEKTFLGIKGIKDNSPAENRGIWFDRGTIVSIKSRSEMGKYFERLKLSGINTIYFETVNAGYTIYPSKIGSQNPLTKGKDPLQWAIEEAHSRNMKIQAWVWVFAVGNDRHNKIIGKENDYVGPVLEKNMKWALLGENGNLRPKNQPEFWIDPSNKDGVNYILKLIDEITTKYNVDGIQLDYIRYPFQSTDNIMGFNHNSAEEFTNKTGEKLFSNNYQTNTLRDKWKESNINSFVKKVYTKTKRTKPNIKISASIFTKSQQSRLSSIQQNWETWAAGNYIDSLTPMSYSMNIGALSSNIAPLKTQIGSCPIYPGIALQHVDEIGIMQQVSKIREEGFSGVSFFAMAQLNSDKSQILQNGFYSKNSSDPSYTPEKSANILLGEYKILMQAILSTNSDLSQAQKSSISSIITNISQAEMYLSSGRFKDSLDTIQKLKNQNASFFKNYSKYNTQTQQTAVSYLKRAENLIKITIKKKS